MRYVSYKITYITLAGDSHVVYVDAADIAMAVSMCFASDSDAYHIMSINRV